MKNSMEKMRFKELLSHVGHHIECVTYGNEETGVINVSIECETCNTVLMDMEKPKNMEYIPIPKEYPKEIAIRWNIYDVDATLDNYGIEMEPPLTEQEMAHVLAEAEHNHDADNGITWDTILFWAEELYGNRIIKKKQT